MIPKSPDYILCIPQEQLRVLRFDVVVLRRLPKVIPDQEAVFVGEIVERLLRTLPDPIADDVLVRVVMQPEIGVQSFTRDPLHRIIHAPITAAASDAHSVYLDDEIRGRAEVVARFDGTRTLASRGERSDP